MILSHFDFKIIKDISCLSKQKQIKVEWFLRKKLGTQQVVQNCFRTPIPEILHFFMLLFKLGAGPLKILTPPYRTVLYTYELASKPCKLAKYTLKVHTSFSIGKQFIRFFNVFKVRQAHLGPKVPKQANFLHILAKFASGNWIMCEFFSTALW